jgi:integrase
MGKVESKLPTGLQFDGSSYTIDKMCDGVRIKRRLGQITLSAALEQYGDILSSAKKGQLDTKTASSFTVDETLVHYYNSHLQHIKSGANAKFHIPAISRHIGHKKVLQLRRSDIDHYKLCRTKEGKLSKTKEGKPNKFIPLSERTIQAELQHLNMAINRAVDDELIPRNTISRFCKVSIPRRKKIVLDHGVEFGPEWIQLYKHLPEQWRLFFLICYETGMRPAEVANLNTSWVTFLTHNQDELLITVPAESEKTGFNDRRIPVSRILKKRLLKIIQDRPGKVFTSWDYFKAFNKAVKNGKLRSEITAYSLRRTRATIWDAIDSQAARVALGHVPLDPHEESYVEITNERLFKLVNITMKHKFKLVKFG